MCSTELRITGLLSFPLHCMNIPDLWPFRENEKRERCFNFLYQLTLSTLILWGPHYAFLGFNDSRE